MKSILSIATLGSIALTQYYKLAPTFQMAFIPAISSILEDFMDNPWTFESFPGNIYYYVGGCIVLSVLWFFRETIYGFLERIRRIFDKSQTIDIYNRDSISGLYRYIRYNPSHFVMNYIEKGPSRYMGLDKYIVNEAFPIYPSKFRIPINSHIFTGTIQLLYGKSIETIGNKPPIIIEIEKPYLRIILSSHSASNYPINKFVIKLIDISDILYIDDDMKRREKLPKRIILKNYIYSEENECAIPFYDCIRTLYNKDVFFTNYIHPLKEFITTIISQPSYKLLIHGPSGTGKKTLIQNIAKYTEKNTITINIQKIDNYPELLDIFTTLKTYKKDTNTFSYYAHIILLTNLDETIRYLYTKERNILNKIEHSTAHKNANITELYDSYKKELLLKDLITLINPSIKRMNQTIIATVPNLNTIKEFLPELLDIFQPIIAIPIKNRP